MALTGIRCCVRRRNDEVEEAEGKHLGTLNQVTGSVRKEALIRSAFVVDESWKSTNVCLPMNAGGEKEGKEETLRLSPNSGGAWIVILYIKTTTATGVTGYWHP